MYILLAAPIVYISSVLYKYYFQKNDVVDEENEIDIEALDGNITKVDEYLYISNFYNSLKYDVLEKLNINVILNCSDDCVHENIPTYITYKQIQLNELCNDDTIKQLKDTYNFISENVDNNKNILVHCKAGKNRSVSTIIFYFMNKYDLSFDNAFDKLHKLYDKADPSLDYCILLDQIKQINL